MRWTVSLLPMMAALAAGCQGSGLVEWSGEHVDVGAAPEHIVWEGGRLYLASGRQVLVLDEGTGRLLRRFSDVSMYVAYDPADPNANCPAQKGQLHPCQIGSIAVAGGKLFANEVFAGNLMVWRLDESGPPVRVRMPDQGRLVAARSGREVYYAGKDAFYRIDVHSLQPTRVSYPKGSKGVGGVLASPDGRMLYLAIARGAREGGAQAPPEVAGPANPLEQTYSGPLLAEYDLVERRYIALRSIGDTTVARGDDASIPTSLCLSEDGKSLYITLWQCGIGVHVYDVGDHCLRKPLVLNAVPGLKWPNCWRSVQAGKDIYVTLNHQSHLVRIDIATGHVTEMGESGKALCRNGPCLYVASSTGIRRIRP
jgi:hypothetical protein